MTNKMKEDSVLPLFRDDGGTHVLRCQVDDQGRRRCQSGYLADLKSGQQTFQEVINLRRRLNSPVCDVETIASSPFGKVKGPSQVTTEQFREGWERVFGETLH
jgi:hypothetical protein